MECSVCFSIFNASQFKPLFLQCGHTFCLYCITKLLADKPGFYCPSCNRYSECLDVESLPVNYSLLQAQSTESLQSKEPAIPCPVHPDKKARLMCSDCDLKLCSRCIDSHRGHNVSSLETASDLILDNERNKLSQWESELEEYKSKVESLSERAKVSMAGARAAVDKMHAEALAKLNSEYQGIVSLLDKTESKNQSRLSEVNRLLEPTLETIRHWLKQANQARFFGESGNSKYSTIERLRVCIRDLNLEMPGLTQSFCSCSRAEGRLIGSVEKSSLSVSPCERKLMAWWYMNNFGTFTPFPKEDSDKLELVYACKASKATLDDHEVDFNALVQINISTTTKRKIKRAPLPSWSWQRASSEFRRYCPLDCFNIERAYCKRLRRINLNISSGKYVVNFETMTQKNARTGVARQVKRS